MHTEANLKRHYCYKKKCISFSTFLYLLYIARKRTFKKDQLMIYIQERTPIFLKRSLPTFEKINLFVANNLLRVVASFFPAEQEKKILSRIFSRFFLAKLHQYLRDFD